MLLARLRQARLRLVSTRAVQGLRSPVASQWAAMRAQVSFAALHQSYYSDLNLKLNASRSHQSMIGIPLFGSSNANKAVLFANVRRCELQKLLNFSLYSLISFAGILSSDIAVKT